MKIDPIFPTGSSFVPPRYKFVRNSRGFRLEPYQNPSPSSFTVEPTQDENNTSAGALLFSLVVYVALILFS